MYLNFHFTSLKRHQNDQSYLKQTREPRLSKLIFIAVLDFMWPAHFSIAWLPSFGEEDFMGTVAQIPRCRSPGVWTHQGPPIQSHSGLWMGHVPLWIPWKPQQRAGALLLINWSKTSEQDCEVPVKVIWQQGLPSVLKLLQGEKWNVHLWFSSGNCWR